MKRWLLWLLVALALIVPLLKYFIIPYLLKKRKMGTRYKRTKV